MTTQEQIDISALRYALGRRTYITGVVAEYLMEKADSLSNKARANMIRDIEHEASSPLPYGDDCDKESWMELLNVLKGAK